MRNDNILAKYTFFLGGNDLEMETIRKILEENNFQENKHFFDKKLGWGAKLSAYEKELENLRTDIIPVLIELTPDKKTPENAKIIDHHNENEDKPSSLEQIVELLNEEFNPEIKFNRWMQLVAANDKGYIPAMECLCATEKEIKAIRDADRKAQGVTEEDERLAEESIQKHKTEENGITVIKSLTNKFSPINDRMYGKTDRLLIYNDKTLAYYGKGKNKIAETFKIKIDEGKAYHGGGISGYFGFDSGKFTKEEIINFKNRIIKMNLNDEKLFSHHIFLFPFKWDLKGEKKLEDSNFEERVKLQEISNIFNRQSDFEKGIIWQDYKFTLNKPRDYNEYTYFYEYVTATLFDDEYDKNEEIEPDNKITLQYFLEFEKGSKYLIDIVGREKMPYELEIEDILINFYQTGIGILSFHLSNYKYYKPEQILDINDFGRRIYPQFLDDENKKDPLASVKKTFLSNSITLKLKFKNQTEQKEIKDCFRSFCKQFNYQNPKKIKKIPDYISILLGKKFNDIENNLQKDDVKITPIIDDRMFTICWYGNDYCARKFSEKKWNKGLNRYEYNFEKNELWNKFIFVDNSTSNNNANTNLLNKHNIQHSYDRWIDYGTLYGISRYSFILLTNREGSFLLPHIQTMYFQLVMLALLQRASLLRFSDEATKVKFIKGNDKDNYFDEEGNKDKKLESHLHYIQKLYERYLHFVNKIFFREPTAQEQGIELYDMLLDKMRIEREVKDLDRELDEVHKYIDLINQKNQTKKMNNISILGAVFLPLSILLSIFSFLFLDTQNLPEYYFGGEWNSTIIIPLILILAIWLFIVFYLNKVWQLKIFEKFSNNRKKNE